ncbi:MAG: Uma2 family endonuclease [Chloroflexota bacterium]|nr:Uma2 family endonuclease [Chloroflexota bacterium]
MTLRSMTPNQFILLTIEDDTEEAPWIMMGDPQMRAVSALYNALSYYLQQTRPDGPGAGNAGWYVASMLPIRFPRPRTTHATGQLGPDLFVAHAEDRPRQSYDMTAGEPPPAFVLEVLSPESVTLDLELKRGAYDELGVQEYALFAPTPDLGQPARSSLPPR